jgi:hypothetical protein
MPSGSGDEITVFVLSLAGYAVQKIAAICRVPKPDGCDLR